MSCTKRRYHTRKEAKTANNTHRGATGGNHSPGLRPYHCTQCGFWHLGHLPASVIHGHITRANAYPSKQPEQP